MTLLEITAAVILLLITTIIILNKPKKPSETEIPLINKAKTSEQAKQESPVVSTPDLNVQPITPIPSAVKPQAEQIKVSQPEIISTLPEDSILRRHTLTHLYSMIESLSPRPTDSVLCRHYDAISAETIYQCLTNEQVMAQLIDDYEHNKSLAKIEPAVQLQKNVPVVSSPKINISRLPEDSILRRHTLTHLNSIIESLSPRPTDSVLCRHYDSMLTAKLEQYLSVE